MADKKVYSRTQVVLHWVVVVLILFNFISGDAMERATEAARSAGAVGGATPHTVVGMMILILMAVRLVIRLRRGPAATLPNSSPAAQRMAEWGHYAIYAAVIGTAVTGASGWMGGVDMALDLHDVMTKAVLVLIAGHIALALFHQFIKRDGSLTRITRF